MPLYFCKGPSTVMGVHGDDQLPALQARTLQPDMLYGIDTYVIVDLGGPAPTMEADPNAPTPPPPDPNLPAPPTPSTDRVKFPDIANNATMMANSVKLECRMRILEKISEQTQRNLTTHISDIQMARMTQAPARPPTAQEQTDMNTAQAIWDWIGRPNGMLQTSDNLIAANDLDFYTDVKWPPWTDTWSDFLAQF